MYDYWLWQHEYRKRWIVYSEEEIQILNKAVEDKEVSVTLPNKNSNKVLVIDFESMIQRNKKTLYEQRVRCLVFSSEFYLWHCKKDNDEWCSFKPNLAALLEVAYLNGEKFFSYYDNGDFEVNLESFELTDKSSLEVFYVKREKVDVSTSVKVKSIQEMGSSTLASLESKKPSLKRKLSDDDTAPATDISMTSALGITMDDEEDSVSSGALIPVDKECPENDSYHIFTKEGVAFAATLNQTCLQKNNNKFYLIQLLEHNETGQFAVWRRWGRVGVRGQSDLTKYGNSFAEAQDTFEKKFYDKTKNHWSDIDNFTYRIGKYDMLHMDLNSSPESQEKKMKPTTNVVSKLAPKLQHLLELISDKWLMEDVMKEMSYDSNKTPLGKLTPKQVQEGYVALNKISEILKEGGGVPRINLFLIDACNEFYTKIPHNFGMKKPPMIRTQFELDAKINMLEALSNIAVAMGVMNNLSTSIEHPLDKYYKSLDCSLEELQFNEPEYEAFEKSLKETHGPTHSSYEMKVIDLFRCHKDKEDTFFKDSNNKYLLWHGSRITNWIGILKEGLKIAPPEAPSTGYMFGKGIYFADVSSKSANYCYATKKKCEGLILLCEVSLGNQHSLYEANERLPASLPSGFHSVKGNGRIAPSEYKTGVLSSDAKAPFGPLIENPDHEGSLHYNEYIVYDVRQVKMKYLARVKFIFK